MFWYFIFTYIFSLSVPSPAPYMTYTVHSEGLPMCVLFYLFYNPCCPMLFPHTVGYGHLWLILNNNLLVVQTQLIIIVDYGHTRRETGCWETLQQDDSAWLPAAHQPTGRCGKVKVETLNPGQHMRSYYDRPWVNLTSFHKIDSNPRLKKWESSDNKLYWDLRMWLGEIYVIWLYLNWLSCMSRRPDMYNHMCTIRLL